jgi:hypothetical protein
LTALFIVTAMNTTDLPEEVFLQNRIWNFVGNRLVETHICGNAQTTQNRNCRSGCFLRCKPLAAHVRKVEDQERVRGGERGKGIMRDTCG